MKVEKLFDDGHQWFVFGRDPEKPKQIIDTNQYMVKTGTEALLIDPGGIEVFAPMLAEILHHANVGELTNIFASHQDPDIISSLGYWDKALPEATLHAPAIWEGFLRHFGCDNIQYASIADEGGSINLDGKELQFIPAHYLHSSANFNVYDPQAKILMSGDIGAALEEPEAPMFIDNFDEHTSKMEYFHKRWMPSHEAKMNWINRIRQMDIDIMAPQHGRIFKGDDIQRFLDWFEELPVGSAIA